MSDKEKHNMEDEELLDDELIEDGVEYEDVSDDDASSGGSKGGFKLDRSTLFIIIGIAAVVVIGAIMFFFKDDPEKNKKADEQMVMAIRYFEVNQDSLAMYGDGQNLGFQTISKKYKGTPAANNANYYMAVISFRGGDVDAGMKYIDKFKTGDNLLSSVALSLKGYGYEEKSQFEKAAKSYEEAARTPEENEFTSPYFLLAAARNYESAGNDAKARSIYEDLSSKYPTSEEGRKAGKYLGRVSNE